MDSKTLPHAARAAPTLAGAAAPARVATPARRRRTLRIPPLIVVCLAILVILALAAIFAPIIAPQDPLRQSLSTRNRPPAWIAGGSGAHLFGTDNLGYDIFSRVLFDWTPYTLYYMDLRSYNFKVK